jgi:GNAT superfamily N-acetyltransferase
VRLELVEEYGLGEERSTAVSTLLHEAFPDGGFTATRTYLKQIPPRRLLAFEQERLVGHLGLEHRVIGTQGGPATIFGVVDLCVAVSAQRRGIASRMLEEVETLARRQGIDFLMLFASDRRLYEHNGYRHEDNVLRWMMVHQHEIIGIDEQPLVELMIKPARERPWPAGLVDLLGHQF